MSFVVDENYKVGSDVILLHAEHNQKDVKWVLVTVGSFRAVKEIVQYKECKKLEHYVCYPSAIDVIADIRRKILVDKLFEEEKVEV